VAIGDPGEVTVLVVGVIHGNENAGLDIVDELRELEPPDGVQLWLLPTINPDGLAADERGNAAGVDLNRNFPHNWGPIAEPGNWQYAGEGPASEPETEAFVEFARNLRPDLTLCTTRICIGSLRPQVSKVRSARPTPR
jgi:protein MpaA